MIVAVDTDTGVEEVDASVEGVPDERAGVGLAK